MRFILTFFQLIGNKGIYKATS